MRRQQGQVFEGDNKAKRRQAAPTTETTSTSMSLQAPLKGRSCLASILFQATNYPTTQAIQGPLSSEEPGPVDSLVETK